MAIKSAYCRFTLLSGLALAGGIGCPQRLVVEPRSNFDIVVFDKECKRIAGSEPVEIWFPGEGRQPTQVIWKFDDLPEGWTAVIDAWTVDQYKTKWKDDEYKEKKAKLFKKLKHEFKHDDKIKSSGEAQGRPFYPGGYAPVWMASLKVWRPDQTNKPHCTLDDPGVCVRGAGGSVCEPSP